MTNWTTIDDSITQMLGMLKAAKVVAQFQAIGVHCRELTISTAQLVYSSQRHQSTDGVTPSDTDAKRMLEAFFAVELSGASNQSARKYARAIVDLANDLQHERRATYRDAALCVQATTALVTFVKTAAGWRDLQSQSELQVAFSFEKLDIHQDEHLYKLRISIHNPGRHTVNALKFVLSFPNLDEIPKRWQSVTGGSKPSGPLVDVFEQTEGVWIEKKDYSYIVTVLYRNPLLPHDSLKLDEMVSLRYRFTHDIYSNLEDMPAPTWKLYADDIAPIEGTIPWDQLNVF